MRCIPQKELNTYFRKIKTMSYAEIEEFSEDDSLLKKEVHRFAEEVIRPASIEIDRMLSDKYQEKITDRDSPYWKVMKEMKKLGYHRAIFPEEAGGAGLSPRKICILYEELSWGSSGFAMALGVDFIPLFFAILSFSNYLRENLIDPWLADEEAKFQGCWAITEPEHGSDPILASSMTLQERELLGPGQVTTRKDGKEWVINGPKSSWISAGPVATHCGLNTDFNFMRGGSVKTCVVPLDLPGVIKGKPIIKLGQRECPQGDIVFEEVRIPDEYMVPFDFTNEADYLRFKGTFLSMTSSFMGVVSTGLARAAFEEALEYSKDRIQGGRPICEHQLIKKKLFDMFAKVELCRAYSRKMLEYVHKNMIENLSFDVPFRSGLIAQVFCKQMAFEVADDAVQIHGGYGTTEDFLVQKLYRDARVKLIEDGTIDALSLEGGHDIVKNYRC